MTDADHDRVEIRCHWVSHDADWLFSDRRYPDENLLCLASPPSPASCVSATATAKPTTTSVFCTDLARTLRRNDAGALAYREWLDARAAGEEMAEDNAGAYHAHSISKNQWDVDCGGAPQC